MNKEEYPRMFAQEATHWWYVGMRSIVLSFLPPSALPHNPRILDAGCGTGYNLGWLQQVYAGRTLGVDLFKDPLKFCRARKHRELANGDISSLPFRSRAFDLVVCFDVLSHVSSEAGRQRAVNEMFRALRPGGQLLLRVAAFDWLRSSHDAALMTHHRYAREELHKSLAVAGFRVVRSTFANTFLFPGAVLWRLFKKTGLAPGGSDVSPLTRGSPLINNVFRCVLELEANLLRGPVAEFPFGLSLLVLACKEDPGTGSLESE